MAAYIDSLGLDFNEDFSVLESALQDEKFKSMLQNTIKELGDDNNLKHYELELKKYEKERGVDVSLIKPSPGIALLCNQDAGTIIVNIGHSEKIDEPLFDVVRKSEKSCLTWKVPHAITQPKIEKSKAVIAQLCNNLHNKKHLPLIDAMQNDIRIYDIIVNSNCLEYMKQNENFKSFLYHTSIESIEKQFNCKISNFEVLANSTYIGTPSPCLIKTICDPIKYKQSEADDISYPLSKMNLSQGSRNHDSTSSVEHLDCKDSRDQMTPPHKLVHINHITLQDFSNAKFEEPISRKPHSLALEIYLVGIANAADIDVEVLGKSFKLETKNKLSYCLELTLPYDVEEEPISAKFDLSTSMLRLELLVTSVKSVSRLTSVSTDSGIECESGYRTSSDMDNSSISSQEDFLEINLNETKTTSVPQNSIEKDLKCSIPNYGVSETNINILLTAASCNVLAKSISLLFIDERTIKISYTTIGGGLMPLLYGLFIYVEPNSVKKSGLHHKIRNNDVLFKLRKAVPGIWETIKIGPNLDCAKVIEMSNAGTTQDLQVAMAISDDRESSDIQNNNTLGSEKSRPRGILKSRTRSLSESHLGCYDVFTTSVELEDDDVLPEEDEAFENSYGKKSVRFSGVVTKQVFRPNSSILGQKIKNQKKSMRRRRILERRLSEGDNSDVKFSEESLPEICNSSQVSSLSFLANNNSAPTTTSTEGETTESDNKTPQSTSAGKSRKRGAKGNKNSTKGNKGQKGRKSRKDAARMNLSNQMIFQFDSV